QCCMRCFRHFIRMYPEISSIHSFHIQNPTFCIYCLHPHYTLPAECDTIFIQYPSRRTIMNRGNVEDITIFSEELQEDMQLLVYLPYNYSPLYKYSLVIASDGKDYIQLGRVPRVVDELLENREIENIIFVGVPYKNVEDRNKKYEPTGSQHG